jgi:hypothetical protein
MLYSAVAGVLLLELRIGEEKSSQWWVLTNQGRTKPDKSFMTVVVDKQPEIPHFHKYEEE